MVVWTDFKFIGSIDLNFYFDICELTDNNKITYEG